MSYLIVTADDVGLHRGMTLGAIRAHREGIVTACSVVANGRELDHAAELLRDCPNLDVGVHLTLVGERPITPPESVPSLVARGGWFVRDHSRFLARHLLRFSAAEVELELRAQIERVLGKGLSPCHLNGHQHLHVLPQILEIVLRLAHEYQIGYVRVPNDRLTAGGPIHRRAAVAALNRLARRARVRTLRQGLRTSDATLGVMVAGHLDVPRLLGLLAAASGVTELVTHPGVGGPDIARTYDWGYAWDAETEALCDPAVPAALARAGIALGGVRGLVD